MRPKPALLTRILRRQPGPRQGRLQPVDGALPAQVQLDHMRLAALRGNFRGERLKLVTPPGNQRDFVPICREYPRQFGANALGRARNDRRLAQAGGFVAHANFP